MPAPVTFHGMPAPRFWEFEDARIDLGALQPGATDLAQMLLVETLTGYGNDWYVIPIDLPVGSLVEARSLVVTDTFGVADAASGRPAIPRSASRDGWSMFSLSMPVEPGDADRRRDHQPVLPAADARRAAGRPGARGGHAACATSWPTSAGRSSAGWRARSRSGSRPRKDVVDLAPPRRPRPRDVPLYRLATPVPEHWVPLLPGARLGRGQRRGAARPRRRARPRRASRTSCRRRPASSTSATRRGGCSIREEEVPREGVVVRRSYQAARWHDGRLFVWAGNRASVGKGEASSGLAFDALDG